TGIIVVLRIVCMCLTTAYGLVSLSHITATWMLRKDFSFAAVHASPLVSVVPGRLVGEFVAVWAVSRTVLFPGLRSLLVLQIVNIPLTAFCFVGAYIARGLRVLMMYTPSRRQRWGRHLKKEGATVKVLLAAYAIVQVAAWIAVQHVGLARVGSFMVIVAMIESLITLGASLVLFGKLRRTNDIFEVSLEIRKVGACALLTTVMITMLGFVPAGILDVYMILFYTVRFHVVVWITNIEPAREILRYSAAPRSRRTVLLPFLPKLTKGESTVAVDTTEDHVSISQRSIKTTVKLDETLQQILLSTPLLQAFKEYCLRALCGEDVVAVSLDGAAKQVGMMLKDKLFDRFRETDQFKQITAKSALKAPGDVKPESYGNAVNVNDRHPS
ncbi:unnamed protein product, partial [Ectocarpus sp. 6 AP-2014]